MNKIKKDLYNSNDTVTEYKVIYKIFTLNNIEKLKFVLLSI